MTNKTEKGKPFWPVLSLRGDPFADQPDYEVVEWCESLEEALNRSDTLNRSRASGDPMYMTTTEASYDVNRAL